MREQVDDRLGLTRAAAQAFGDGRRGVSVVRSARSLSAQRSDDLWLGWSVVCDHAVLRCDCSMPTDCA